MSKKILFFIILFLLSGATSIVFSQIIPLKKPLLTKEEAQKKLLVDILKPIAKPVEKDEKELIKKDVVVKKEKKKNLYFT